MDVCVCLRQGVSVDSKLYSVLLKGCLQGHHVERAVDLVRAAYGISPIPLHIELWQHAKKDNTTKNTPTHNDEQPAANGGAETSNSSNSSTGAINPRALAAAPFAPACFTKFTFPPLKRPYGPDAKVISPPDCQLLVELVEALHGRELTELVSHLPLKALQIAKTALETPGRQQGPILGPRPSRRSSHHPYQHPHAHPMRPPAFGFGSHHHHSFQPPCPPYTQPHQPPPPPLYTLNNTKINRGQMDVGVGGPPSRRPVAGGGVRPSYLAAVTQDLQRPQQRGIDDVSAVGGGGGGGGGQAAGCSS
ncbi:unnamed protein product [Vitrella brassicaformis CCMP3155]|uniref:Uncharacterized protein n=1 Tax=Vitrella brassicaformis (strain CCMP3155) TaxID=1169540 RepID=A0A0G4E960_VITBC|nr:unnamed protein product [Vitrella brassicaformis CCMP3155]|eukprot:CEL91762.1 unnamed protein product [Vitrella brassicaformis CCMP3155]